MSSPGTPSYTDYGSGELTPPTPFEPPASPPFDKSQDVNGHDLAQLKYFSTRQASLQPHLAVQVDHASYQSDASSTVVEKVPKKRVSRRVATRFGTPKGSILSTKTSVSTTDDTFLLPSRKSKVTPTEEMFIREIACAIQYNSLRAQEKYLREASSKAVAQLKNTAPQSPKHLIAAESEFERTISLINEDGRMVVHGLKMMELLQMMIQDAWAVLKPEGYEGDSEGAEATTADAEVDNVWPGEEQVNPKVMEEYQAQHTEELCEKWKSVRID